MELTHDMLTHGVNIVSAQHEGKRAGMTLAWATQVGPDRALVCIGPQSHTRELIIASGAFGVSVLSRSELEAARFFGTRSSRVADKFERFSAHALDTGSPVLDVCALAFDCEVEKTIDLDENKLFIGRIVSVERHLKEFEPLVFRGADY